ncbi:MAG TPA: 1-deoxy-D-xylulose-5-phosphate reductoisomerase [Verrucomicrobiae bacterium]|nr:1-deoxy-D-xylulose-5-phosphate reductoisomerase [Verrucomicrobiae bacterium]
MKPKNIVLLGTTGSIGVSTQKVAADLPEQIRIVGMASRENVDGLEKAVRQFKPLAVAMTNCERAKELERRLSASAKASADKGGKIPVHAGERGLVELATMPEADMVLVAIVGTAGLEPALAAIRAGKDLAVASKEILVMAGELVMSEARQHGVKVLPVDSEHSAIFQCLEGRDPRDVKRLILTASGGPFRQTPREEFAKITVAQALKHPSWNMGQKITIDSATLFNKGLEMIEARWLFDLDIDRVDVVIHPQSVVHSMVEFVDGSILAQLSVPDMRYPIQYALTWPRRLPNSMPPTNFAKIGTLTFEDPDHGRFSSLRLAREAGRAGGTMPAVFNAANEVAVRRFVDGQIGFNQIFDTVEKVMRVHHQNGRGGTSWVASPTLDVILEADLWARKEAERAV